MTRSIMFLMVETRPNIAFATSLVSCFAKNPSHQYTKAAKTILKYLKGLKNQRITDEGKEELKIKGYSDSNWAGDKESRKSILDLFLFWMMGPWVGAQKDNLPLLSPPQKRNILRSL